MINSFLDLFLWKTMYLVSVKYILKYVEHKPMCCCLSYTVDVLRGIEVGIFLSSRTSQLRNAVSLMWCISPSIFLLGMQYPPALNMKMTFVIFILMLFQSKQRVFFINRKNKSSWRFQNSFSWSVTVIIKVLEVSNDRNTVPHFGKV